MSRYVLSREAETDLLSIQTYLVANAGRRVTRYVLLELRRALLLLSKNPELVHCREDLSNAPVLFWPVFSYLIVYDPAPRPIEIVRILHAKQDIGPTLGFDPGA